MLHDDDALGALGRDAEVVRDEQHGRAALAPQLVDEVEDAPLNGDVERARGLVGDHELGLQGHGVRDEHPLAHAARELVRVLAGAQRRVVEADALQQVEHAAPDVATVAPPVDAERVGELHADRPHRVERRHRILRDVPDARAAHALQAAVAPARDVGAREADRARVDAAARRQQAEHGARRGGLARSGLPHERDDLTGLHVERDPVHDAARTGRRGVGDVEAVEFEERGHRVLPSEWLMRLAESTTTTTTRPGSTVSHHEVAT